MNKKYRLNEEISITKVIQQKLILIKELDTMRQFIQTQWLNTIKKHNPKVAEEISTNQLSMNKYHLISESLDHSKMWGKISNTSFIF